MTKLPCGSRIDSLQSINHDFANLLILSQNVVRLAVLIFVLLFVFF